VNELAPRWRRELAWGSVAAALAAAPSFVGQIALGRALGKAGELAALLSLGSTSRLHLALQPLDAWLGGAARLVMLAAAVWLLAWVLLGAPSSLRGVVAATARAARVLAWAPAAACLIGGAAAYVWWEQPPWAGEPPLWELAYGAMAGWLVVQATLWLWVLGRLGRLLRAELGLGAGEAALLGWAPAWALGLVGCLEALLP
jgi:hypothetical protein